MIPSSKVMFYLIIFLEPCLAVKSIDFEDIPNQWKITCDFNILQLEISNHIKSSSKADVNSQTLGKPYRPSWNRCHRCSPASRLRSRKRGTDQGGNLSNMRWPWMTQWHHWMTPDDPRIQKVIRNIHIKIYIYIDALFKYIRYYVNHYKSLIKDTRRISSQKAGILKTQNVLPFEAQARPCHLANTQLTPVYHPKAKKI